MWRIRQILLYVLYRFRAKSPDQLHSPFLYALLTAIHDEQRYYYLFDQIERIRAHLLKDPGQVPVRDLGAGSQKLSPHGHRKICEIAGTSLSSAARCRMVCRLLKTIRPRNVLELGTSLGIMTSYLAGHDTSCAVHTIEGNPAISAIAAQTAARAGLSNITFHPDAFDAVLPGLLPGIKPIDFVLIDGDHRGAALSAYYHMIRPFLSEDAIVMIDDIRWSQDMYESWNEIRKDPHIRCCVDYFGFGLLFFTKRFTETFFISVYPGKLL